MSCGSSTIVDGILKFRLDGAACYVGDSVSFIVHLVVTNS